MCCLLHVVDENTPKLFEFWVAVLCCFAEDSLRIFAEAVAAIDAILGLGIDANMKMIQG